MTYHNAIKFIKNAPNITPPEASASDRIQKLLSAIGNPQKRIKYVRLAGSNGKTVCARMLISILNCANIQNGCLSMPIQDEIRENIKINGNPLSMDETVKYVETVYSASNSINENIEEEASPFRPTAHEILLCVSLLAFVDHSCSICIIESDHNGEDPSKFINNPFSAVICGRIPNNDKQEISKIRSYIRRGIQEIISAPQNQEAYKIIFDTCVSANCRFTQPTKSKLKISSLSLRNTSFSYKGFDYSMRLCGRFQIANAIVAIESAEMLVRCGYKIPSQAIKEGLTHVTAPCKFEVLSMYPTIIADSTHTPIAIGAVCDSLSEFKDITGDKIRLCLPDGELVQQYVNALQKRGYSIEKISALLQDEDAGSYTLPVNHKKTAVLTAKDALSGLEQNSVLLISGPSTFTKKLRYEILRILGF